MFSGSQGDDENVIHMFSVVLLTTFLTLPPPHCLSPSPSFLSILLFTTSLPPSSSLLSLLALHITGKRKEVMRWRIERNEGWRGDEED
jgi:hypothetical protein